MHPLSRTLGAALLGALAAMPAAAEINNWIEVAPKKKIAVAHPDFTGAQQRITASETSEGGHGGYMETVTAINPTNGAVLSAELGETNVSFSYAGLSDKLKGALKMPYSTDGAVQALSTKHGSIEFQPLIVSFSSAKRNCGFYAGFLDGRRRVLQGLYCPKLNGAADAAAMTAMLDSLSLQP